MTKQESLCEKYGVLNSEFNWTPVQKTEFQDPFEIKNDTISYNMNELQ